MYVLQQQKLSPNHQEITGSNLGAKLAKFVNAFWVGGTAFSLFLVNHSDTSQLVSICEIMNTDEVRSEPAVLPCDATWKKWMHMAKIHVSQKKHMLAITLPGWYL